MSLSIQPKISFWNSSYTWIKIKITQISKNSYSYSRNFWIISFNDSRFDPRNSEIIGISGKFPHRKALHRTFRLNWSAHGLNRWPKIQYDFRQQIFLGMQACLPFTRFERFEPIVSKSARGNVGRITWPLLKNTPSSHELSMLYLQYLVQYLFAVSTSTKPTTTLLKFQEHFAGICLFISCTQVL